MRKLGLVIVVLSALVGASPGEAHGAFAPLDTLIQDGKCKVGTNWSMGSPPGAYDAYVPAGKTLRVEGAPTKACSMRSLLLEGTLAGNGPITIGNSLRAEGPDGPDIALKITPGAVWNDLTGVTMMSEYTASPQILDMGPSDISEFRVAGTAHYQLGEPAHYESIWHMSEGSYFDTAGYWIGGMGDTAVGLAATLKLHGSEWDTGEWRVAATVALEAAEATVYQDDGSYGVTECHGQTLGNLIVRNFRPHLVNPCTIPGTLSLDQTADHSPIVFSGTFLPNERLEPTRLTIGALATNGTAERSVVCEGRATIVLPHGEEVRGALDVSEWTVEGGTLYLPEGSETASTGVVIGTEP